jgi:hypothetical protein
MAQTKLDWRESMYAPEASFEDGASSWWSGSQRREEKSKQKIGWRSTSKDQRRLHKHSMGQAR